MVISQLPVKRMGYMTNKYHYDPETCILYDSPRPGTVPYGEYNHALAEAGRAHASTIWRALLSRCCGPRVTP